MWNARYLSEHEFINTSTFCICQSGLGGVSSVEAWPASLFLLLLTISCSGFPQQTKPVGNWSQHTFLVVLFNSLTSLIWKTLGKISSTLISTAPYQIYTMVDKCQVLKVWLGKFTHNAWRVSWCQGSLPIYWMNRETSLCVKCTLYIFHFSIMPR